MNILNTIQYELQKCEENIVDNLKDNLSNRPRLYDKLISFLYRLGDKETTSLCGKIQKGGFVTSVHTMSDKNIPTDCKKQ